MQFEGGLQFLMVFGIYRPTEQFFDTYQGTCIETVDDHLVDIRYHQQKEKGCDYHHH